MADYCVIANTKAALEGEEVAVQPTGTVTNTGTLTADAVILGNDGVDVKALAMGTAGQVLTVNAGATAAEWAAATGGGNVNAAGTLTQYAVVLGDGSTDVAVVSGLGSSGNVLTSNGAGVAPTFQAPSGGASWVLLDTQTVTSAATLEFSNKLSATYDNYVVLIDDLLPVSYGVDVFLRIGTGSGPTWDTASNYAYAVASVINSSSDSNDGSNSAAQFRLIQAMHNDATAGGMSGILYFFGANSAKYKHISWQISGMTDAGGFRGSNGSGYHKNTTVSTSLQLYFSSGNISSGTARLYGITQ